MLQIKQRIKRSALVILLHRRVSLDTMGDHNHFTKYTKPQKFTLKRYNDMEINCFKNTMTISIMFKNIKCC